MKYTYEDIEKMKADSKEKRNAINDALFNFVLRVANDPKARRSEILALPEVARVVLKSIQPSPIKQINFGSEYELTD